MWVLAKLHEEHRLQMKGVPTFPLSVMIYFVHFLKVICHFNSHDANLIQESILIEFFDLVVQMIFSILIIFSLANNTSRLINNASLEMPEVRCIKTHV